MQKFTSFARWLVVAVAILAAGATLAKAQDRGPQPFPQNLNSEGLAAADTNARMHAAYAQLPLIFEANQGQTDARVKFLARGEGYGLFLTRNSAVLSLQRASKGKLRGAVVRMDLAGSRTPGAIAGTDLLPGTSSYFIGNDPSKWHSHIPQFAQVRYSAVYPGIDLIYYGKQGKLEYDFRVAPGADAGLVKLHFSGGENLRRAENGDIVLTTSDGDVRLHAPQIYQQSGAERQPVTGAYELLGDNDVKFAVGAYDHSRELVIDPVLTYSSYLGGSGNEACTAILGTTTPVPGCPSMAVDAISNVYIASISNSTDFPNPTAPPTLNGTANVAISKINIAATGATQLVNSIFIGGNGTDIPAAIAVDSSFRVIVAGTTSSTNFPAIQAYQSTPASSGKHAFVTKIDLTANSLLYSTYLSGNGVDTASGMALDGSGNVYVTGTTTSTDVSSQTDVFPATLGSFQSSAASLATNKFFFTKLNPFSSGAASILYSTYFGGGNPSNGVAIGGGIALDPAGNVYLTGGTNFLNTQNNPSTDFPILNALQVCLDTPVNPGSGTCSVALTATDAFVAKFSPVSGSTNQFTLNYSTYLGGTGDDIGFGVASDTAGEAFVTGSTTSNDFVLPTITNPFQSANGGASDAFVAKLSPFSIVVGTTANQAVVLDYFSYLGGSGADAGLAIASDNTGGAYVAGYTESPNFPTNNGVFTANAGGRDAFAARMDTNATTATTPSQFMTYLGGAGSDAATSVVRDTQGGTLVAGETASSNLPTANPFQGSLAGSSDAFVARFGPSVNLTMTGSASPSPVGIGNQVTFTYTITNNGDALPGLTFTENYPATGVSNVTGSSGGGACGGTSGTLVCSVGPVAGAGATTTVTVLMVPNTGASLGTTATVTAAGCPTQFCASTQVSANITDFGVAAQPPSATAVAGQPTTYQITVNPINFSNLPEAVTLACSSTLPTGASCVFTNNPITSLTGPQTRTLVVNTTARTTTTVQNFRGSNLFYATLLSLSGLVLVGACFGGTESRKRRLMIALFVCGLFGAVFVQVGCGSSGSTTTVSGTPAGSYNITVTATTGSASRSTVLTLNVQ